MSKKEVQNEEEKKIVTKYDLKMQRREEEKAKAKREQRVSLVTGIVVVVALFCFVASFPIRSWLTVNGTYIKVGGEKVTRLEFDYYYHTSLNNYANTYGSYLSYMGIDLTGDLSKQMYSADLSFKDYFEEMAVENLTQNKALLAEAKAALVTLEEKVAKAGTIENAKELAFFFKDEVRVAMGELRAPIDALEMLVDKEVWPVPTYGDLIFEV